MCEGPQVFTQFKQMASLDYSAISDNVTRELLVIALESPEAFDTVRSIYDAAKCTANAVGDDGVNESEGGTSSGD